MKRLLAFAVALVVLSGLEARAQQPREIHTSEPSLRGRAAFAPVPSKMHVHNEGGSDGSGLCVVSSVLANGMAQGVPGFAEPGHDEASGKAMPGKGSALWKTAKSRPGGYSPTKLQGLLDEVAPGEKWASYVGTDVAVLEKLSRSGYRIGATMNTGELYNYKPIHHMVSLSHFDRDQNLAMFEDNNRPGVFTWVTASEYARRWIDGGSGWAFVWLRRATSHSGGEIACIVAVATLILVLGIRRYRSEQAEDAEPITDQYPSYYPETFADEW